MEVIKEELATYARAKKVLEKTAEGKELGYEQNNALEFLKKFARLSEKKTQELIEELGKAVPKLKDRHKILIANSLPEDLDDLRVLLAHEIVSLTEDEKKGVLSAVKAAL
ncbi:MAG: DNA-directed RNA polymerase subunit F [Candidatus Aenigmarchaeota archaeon]|nr:DNA-directed RNA polymerase subunit F [Candidatus Aenigmarchaeota archaeon]